MQKILCFLVVLAIGSLYGCAVSDTIISPISVPYQFRDHIINRVSQSVSFEYTNDTMQVYFADSTKTIVQPNKQKITLPWDSIDTDTGTRKRAPSVLERIQPEYPPTAEFFKVEGKVIVSVWINSQGDIKKVVMRQSGAELFNQSVFDAVKRWKFIPPSKDAGIPGVWAILEFDFFFKGSRPIVIMPN